MAKAKFNERGELVNSETGEPIGTKTGNRISIDSRESKLFSLEDYGVGIPEFPDDGHDEREDEDDDFASVQNTQVKSDDNVQVNSSDAAKVAQKPESHVDVGPTSFSSKRTKYEVTKDSYFIVRFGLYQKEDGRFVPIKDEMVDDIPESERHWVKFRMWNYSEELKWKSEFLEYNNATKSQFLNTDRLNERKIRHLMLDWSFGSFDDRLKLLHCDGVLSDESYSMFMGMYPSIAGTIVDLMNLVLESNQ